MTDEKNKINRIFEQLPIGDNSYFSKVHVEKITAEFGAETAAHAEKIFHEAINVRVDWRTATMDSGLDAMYDFLEREYPWLSSKALTNINYAFIMTWK